MDVEIVIFGTLGKRYCRLNQMMDIELYVLLGWCIGHITVCCICQVPKRYWAFGICGSSSHCGIFGTKNRNQYTLYVWLHNQICPWSLLPAASASDACAPHPSLFWRGKCPLKRTVMCRRPPVFIIYLQTIYSYEQCFESVMGADPVETGGRPSCSPQHCHIHFHFQNNMPNII